jgi:hypothetical protein
MNALGLRAMPCTRSHVVGSVIALFLHRCLCASRLGRRPPAGRAHSVTTLLFAAAQTPAVELRACCAQHRDTTLGLFFGGFGQIDLGGSLHCHVTGRCTLFEGSLYTASHRGAKNVHCVPDWCKCLVRLLFCCSSSFLDRVGKCRSDHRDLSVSALQGTLHQRQLFN